MGIYVSVYHRDCPAGKRNESPADTQPSCCLAHHHDCPVAFDSSHRDSPVSLEALCPCLCSWQPVCVAWCVAVSYRSRQLPHLPPSPPQ